MIGKKKDEKEEDYEFHCSRNVIFKMNFFIQWCSALIGHSSTLSRLCFYEGRLDFQGELKLEYRT